MSITLNQHEFRYDYTCFIFFSFIYFLTCDFTKALLIYIKIIYAIIRKDIDLTDSTYRIMRKVMRRNQRLRNLIHVQNCKLYDNNQRNNLSKI